MAAMKFYLCKMLSFSHVTLVTCLSVFLGTVLDNIHIFWNLCTYTVGGYYFVYSITEILGYVLFCSVILEKYCIAM
uniref:Uncharacterized protein n=1 Tax=Anguilla anguilla TaxID=7936 RepID=A0A0E9TBU1_ANGAN